MRIVWSILRQELRLQMTSTRFRLLALTGMLLAVVAATIGARDFAFREDQYAQRFLERQKRREAEPRVDGRAVEPTLRIVRPPQPLSVFVRGLDAVTPPYWDVSPAGVIEGPTDPSIGQDSEVGEVYDLESVFRIVLGLMALMLAVDSVAGQRASGTLHALMLQPIPRWVVVFCKCLAGGIALFAAISLVSITGLAVLFAATGSLNLGIVGFLATIDVVAWVYLLTLFGIGLSVGARARNSERAALVAISIWVFAALVAPQLVAFGVRALVSVPPRQTMERDRQNLYDQRLRSTELVLGGELADVSGTDPAKRHIDQEVHARIDAMWRAETADTHAIIGPVEAQYAAAIDRRRRLTRWLARLNPGSLLIEVSTNLASTGRNSEARWQADAEAYQTKLNATLFDDRPSLSLRPKSDSGYRIQSFDRRDYPKYFELPAFSQGKPDRPSMWEERADLIALSGFLVAALGIGLALFPRHGL